MMLYLPPAISPPHGLGVAHVTLHTSIASVPGLLSTGSILERIDLIDGFLRQVGCPAPRIGICALNPHAGEDGLFGDEEQTLIAPAIEKAIAGGINARGPLPADTLLRRAVVGEFDGVVAMYHDQGHIPVKVYGFEESITANLGLPFVRTSVDHGTAFDIAGRGVASHESMLESIRLAVALAQGNGLADF